MNVSIVKGVRKVKLLKRERDTLAPAQRLCEELSTLIDGKVGESFDKANVSIGDGMAGLNGTEAPATKTA